MILDIDDPSVGVRPCGGIEKSNLYCCDDGLTGAGSFACCSVESSIFTYDNITTLPTILATIPINEVSTTMVESTSSSSLIVSTGSDTSTGLPTVKATSTESIPIQPTGDSAGHIENGSSSINVNISTALGAGLGVGLSVAAAIIGGFWFMVWRSKREHTGETEREKDPYQGVLSGFIVPDGNTPKPATSPGPLELYGVANSRETNAHELPSGYYGRELPA
ncbi:hypothetical protein F5Y00DRAFT_230950 [Daldinia vernicosa]|uniref:uncharacterized protein n=1 Tax=Daldinia vernicosa TaxID=114800 RepID=UPI002008312E|nr:uncharacterized protein F5Y00DRAFT_230950 [Daldinia vernicosa]KAI0851335.1 hypothetical protein F5Y00DRAFT_230950 [Daldinia vernicosa]